VKFDDEVQNAEARSRRIASNRLLGEGKEASQAYSFVEYSVVPTTRAHCSTRREGAGPIEGVGL
jgi:hypothetical protein